MLPPGPTGKKVWEKLRQIIVEEHTAAKLNCPVEVDGVDDLARTEKIGDVVERDAKSV